MFLEKKNQRIAHSRKTRFFTKKKNTYSVPNDYKNEKKTTAKLFKIRFDLIITRVVGNMYNNIIIIASIY